MIVRNRSCCDVNVNLRIGKIKLNRVCIKLVGSVLDYLHKYLLVPCVVRGMFSNLRIIK